MKKKDYLLNFLSGIALSFSFPPYNYFFLAWFLPAVPLYYLFSEASAKNSFLTGVVWGIGFFGVLIYWIVFPTPWGALLILLLAAYFGAMFLLMGLWIRACRRVCPAANFLEWSGIPLIWILAEYARNYFLTGFPWGQLGYSQFAWTDLIQSASVTGVYGVTFLLACGSTLIARMAVEKRLQGNVSVSIGRWFMAFVALVLGMTTWGAWRGDMADRAISPRTGFGIVQGNISLEDKWNPAKKDENLETYLSLSRTITGHNIDVLVWPESALPFYYTSDILRRHRLDDFIRESKIVLLTGGLDRTSDASKTFYWNSVFCLRPDGMASKYDKTHLVPYGEYTPALIKTIFPFITKLTDPGEDFSPGKKYECLQMSTQGRAGPLVCYEDIFPEISRALVQGGAQVLVNVSNDAWFGKSTGVYQHLGMAAFRAVENGVYLIRAANTGPSAIISSRGRVMAMSGSKSALFNMHLSNRIFCSDTLSAAIPMNVQHTFYTRHGDIFLFLCMGLFGGLLIKLRIYLGRIDSDNRLKN